MTTPTFHSYLDQVLRQWRRTILLQGLALTIASAGVLTGLFLGVDHLFSVGVVVRLVFLAALVAVTGYATVRFLLHPLRTVPTDLQIARYVEERRPDLNDSFVSAVEFEGKSVSPEQQLLLNRLFTQVSEQTGTIDFGHMVDAKRLRRAQGLAVLAVAFLALLAARDADLFGRSLIRLAAPWSRTGPLMPTGLTVEPGDARVARGSAQTITVILDGKLASHVRLLTRQNEGDDWDSVEMSETEVAGKFVFEAPSINTDTKYYIAADRTLSPTFTLSVFDAPQVERIDLSYTFPDYVGLPPKTEEDKGDITGPVGTVVRLSIKANKPIRKGVLRFSNGTEAALAVNGSALSGTLNIREDLSYTVQILDSDGMVNPDPIEYYIRAQLDQGPHVAIVEPGRDTRVSSVEEVLIRAEAEDDFGLSTFTLAYSVNGAIEKTIDLKTDGQGRTVWKGSHTIYLEELSVKPGDFISYYASVADQRGTTSKVSTDLYFLEVKPFDETFRQGAGGGGGGGDVAGLQPGRLTQQQKEIISATWRVKRDEGQSNSDQRMADLKAIADAQDRVLQRAQETMNTLEYEIGGDESIKMMNLLEKALEPMDSAAEALRGGSPDQALPLEQQALSYLMQVDALIREFSITMARNGGGGGAPLDTGDTSQLELKPDENRYESPEQANQAQRQSQTIDESLQRVKELAQRQQSLNNQMRQLATNEPPSEAEKRRELDRLTREQSQLRQQAEQLAKQLSQTPSGQSDSRDMKQPLRDATQGLRQSSEEMARSGQELQRNNPQQASGQGSRALQQLEDARQQLQRAQGQSLEKLTRDTAQRADQLAARQEQAARAVEELKKEQDRGFSGVRSRLDAMDRGKAPLTDADKTRRVDEFLRKRLQEIGNGKEQLRQDVQRLQRDLDYLRDQSAKEQPATSAAAEKASESISERQLPQKIDRTKGLLRPGGLEKSARAEKELLEDFKSLADQVRTAQKNLVAPDRDQLARMQDDLRQALNDWQNIERQLDRIQRGASPNTLNQLSRDYRENLQQLQNLADRSPQNTQSGQQLREALNRAAQLGNEPWKIDRQDWSQLRDGVNRNLQDIHRSLGDQIQKLVQREKLHMARDEDVPPDYRNLVNDYYEKLSKDGQ